MFNKKQIYLDNAASSYPKPLPVYREVFDFIRNNGANPGRSGHKMSFAASLAVFETREKAADYFGLSNSGDVIFTKNATEALNTAIFSVFKNGKKRFLTSVMDHNSVLRPLTYLKENFGAEVDFFVCDSFLETVKEKNPEVVVCTAASNVTGNILPLDQISDYCFKHEILFIIDASQTAGYPFSYNCDIICSAGHKGLYGPQGSGLLIVKTSKGKDALSPVFFGGNGTESLNLSPEIIFPESFECGTVNTPAIVGLGAGLDFVRKNEKEIFEKEKFLQKYAFWELAGIKNVTVYTDIDNSVPIIAFNIDGVSSEEATSILADNNICVRGGYHCAPLCHELLETIPGGAIRVSIGAFNKLSDIKKLIKIVSKTKK